MRRMKERDEEEVGVAEVEVLFDDPTLFPCGEGRSFRFFSFFSFLLFLTRTKKNEGI